MKGVLVLLPFRYGAEVTAVRGLRVGLVYRLEVGSEDIAFLFKVGTEEATLVG